MIIYDCNDENEDDDMADGDHDDKYTLMHKVELSFCEMPITSIITKHVHIKSDIEEHIAWKCKTRNKRKTWLRQRTVTGTMRGPKGREGGTHRPVNRGLKPTWLEIPELAVVTCWNRTHTQKHLHSWGYKKSSEYCLCIKTTYWLCEKILWHLWFLSMTDWSQP